ncbi:MAG: DUF2079 domain-containing protein [Burkholderiales bacterium]
MRWSSSVALAAAGLLLVLYAALCKALLFHGLEYTHTDFFSFVEMSRSLFETGELLRDNVYGRHAAIHNYYLLVPFSPLVLAFGAYGLTLSLVVLYAAAVSRLAFAPSLDLPGRVAVLGGYLSPIAYAVFDDPGFGFHTELWYPPLCVLLALDLREGRTRRAILVAALMLLVKEDGAVLCACVLVAHYALRLWELRAAPRDAWRPVATAALWSLAATVVAFAAGMALLWLVGRALPQPQETAEVRIVDALRNVGHAVAGRGRLRDNLAGGLAGYVAVGVLTLLPLGRRLGHGLALLLVASPPLLAVLVVSAGTYRFNYMLWPHRLAALSALAAACLALVFPAVVSGRRALIRVAALLALTWTAQLVALDRAVGYPARARLDALALARGGGTRAAGVPPEELRFLRCLGGRLPRGLPVSAFGDLHPVFHRQSIVFDARAQYARHAAKLRVVPASGDGTAPEAGFCRVAGAEGLEVLAECGLAPLVESCRQEVPEPARR